MDENNKRQKWREFQKRSFNSRAFSQRVKKAEGVSTRHAHRFVVKRIDSVRLVRRRVIAWIVVVGVLIATTGFHLISGQSNYKTATAVAGGTYAEGTLGPIGTLNPLFARTDAEAAASKLLFSSLYRYDKTGNLQADLARTLKVDESGQTYTISLRSNAFWHDGAKVTAKDIVFTINLIKNPETRSSLQATWQDVGVKALDENTVEFTLPAVYAAFPHALTFAVLPEHNLGKVAPGAVRENTFSRSPIGSGPFQFSSLQNADSRGDKKVILMNANQKYYNGAPKLNKFEIHSYLSRDQITDALLKGVVSAAEIAPSDSQKMKDAGYDIISQPINNGVYALFNVKNPILKDRNVRRALQLVSDTEKMRKKLYFTTNTLDTPFIEGQLTGKDIPHASKPNEKKAAQILDKAGWKLKDGTRMKGKTKLAFTITTTKNKQYDNALDELASQWRKVGATVTTNVIDTTDPSVNFIQNTLQPRNYDVLLYELIIGGDPDVYAYWHSSQIGMTGYNFSNYTNKSADTALVSARARLEPELRNAKYKKFSEQWLSDVPAIGLYQSVFTYASNRNTTPYLNSYILVSPSDRYNFVSNWSVREGTVYRTP